MKELQEAKALVSAMEDGRQTRLPVWRLIQRHILPQRGLFGGETAQSAKENASRRLSSAGTRAIRRTAAGLTSSITPQDLRWFTLTPADRNILELPNVRTWLDDIETKMRTALTNSGFYPAIHNLNMDFTGFACSLMFLDSDKDTLMRFEDCAVGTWAVQIDANGKLSSVCRRLKFSANALKAKYPSTISEHVKQLCDNPQTSLTEVEIIHLVTPNPQNVVGKIDRISRPWRHLVWEADNDNGFLLQGGYYEMPYFYVVWDKSHNAYGSGPGDDALGDVIQAQELKRLNLASANLRVNPPLLVPSSYQGRVSITPGSMNRYSAAEADAIRPVLQGLDYNSAESRAELQATEADINDSLMATIFITTPMEERPPGMTATEFLSRRQERLLQLGPAVSRYMTDLFDVLVRVYNILDRAGQIPMPPSSITNPGALNIGYTSPMAQALKRQGVESTQAMVDLVFTLAKADSSALDKLNVDEVIDVVAVDIGAPGRIIRSDEETAKIRQQRAQAAAAAQQAEQARQASEIAVKAGAVPMEGTVAGAMAPMLGIPEQAQQNQQAGGSA